MAKNTLFHFLTGFQSQAHANGIKIEQDVNKNNVPYVRIPLPSTALNNLDGWQILEHHLSIYCNENDANPFLSQYHYTGHILDNLGNQWKSHVFFNEQDTLIHSDHVLTSSGTVGPSSSLFSPMPSLSFAAEASIHALAESLAKPILIFFRESLKNKIALLKLDYERLEQEACLLSTGSPIDQYLEGLNKINAVLNELCPLVRHTPYEGIKKFINRLITNRCQDRRTPAAVTEAESSTNPATEPAFLFSPKAAVRSKKKKTAVLDPQKEIKRLAERVEQLKTAEPAVVSRQLPILFTQLNAQSMTITAEQSTPLTAMSLAQLHQLHRNLMTIGEQTFRRWVLQGQFKLAATLTPFHNLLSPQHVELALHLNNQALLDFVLTYGHQSLLKHPVTVRGNVFPSAVHACIKLDTPAKPMHDCLAVLLAHRAPLLQRDDNGLPVGHVILSNKDGTLCHAFYYHPENTIDNPAFFSHLINALTVFLNQHPELTASERETLQTSIKEYGYNKTIAQWTQYLKLHPGGRVLIQNRKEFIELATSTPHIKRLLADPDYLALTAEKCQLSKSYLGQCGDIDRKKWLKSTSNYHKSMLKGVGKLDQTVFLLQLISYDMFKQENLKNIQTEIDNLKITLETLTSEQGLRRHPLPSSQATESSQLICNQIEASERLMTDNLNRLPLELFEDEAPASPSFVP